jgi:outer membrane protein insertion porin family
VAGLAHAEVSPLALNARVRSIRFQAPSRIDRADYRSQLPLRVGEALSREKLDASVEWLRSKEIFESVTVEATAADGGAAVVFHLEPMPFVVGVGSMIETPSGEAAAVDEETLMRRARIREDEPLSADRVAAAKRRILDLLAGRGYPDAAVVVETVPVRPGQVQVVLRVQSGRPVTIADVELTGLDPAWEEEVRLALPVQAGRPAAENDLAAGRAALLAAVRTRGFYEAEVAAAKSAAGDRVTLRYQVHLGPRFDIEIAGNHAFSRQDLLGLIDLTTRPVVTRGTWQLMAVRMQEHYRAQGYPFAEVDVADSGTDPQRLLFGVQEGPQVHVREVRFTGNRALSAKELIGLMQTRATSRWSRFRLFGNNTDLFREDILADDLEQIRNRYRELGYLTAVIHEGRPQFSDDRQWATVDVEIAEGRLSTVGAVEVEGVGGILADPAQGLSLRSGLPFRPEALQEDRRLLVARLGALGYADAKVTAEAGSPIARDGIETVDVRYSVAPGAQMRIGRVIIQRNYFTLDHVVRRALPFTTGDPLDPEKLSAGQTALHRTGLFRSVAIRPIQEKGTIRDVGVEVGERPNGELQYGFGYDTRAGLHNFLQIAHRNVWGTGDQLSLRGDLNLAPGNLVPDEYIVSLDGKNPRFLGSTYDWKANALAQQSERSIDEYSIRRFSVSSGFEKEFLPGLRGTMVVEFQANDVFNVDPDTVITAQDVGRFRTVTLNPIVVYDGRDDAFAPTRGVFDSLRLRYGSPPLGTEVHFLKAVLQHSQYVPLGDRLTWIYSGRFGLGQPLGFTPAIPLTERFFLGGRTSVRGYKENAIGPKGADGSPQGGDILVNLTSEVRFPLFLGLGGAVFWDGGGLYLHARAVSMHDFRQGVGPGLRYQTPIGAISLDYGFKIRRRSDESIGEVHFSIGNIF